MADASSVVAGAAKLIASALVTEAKHLYGVEDQLRALQRELERMHEFLQTVEANPYLLKQDEELRILANNMRGLAFQAEDVIDTYLVDVRFKTFKKDLFLKVVSLSSNAYLVHMLIKKVEAIRKETGIVISKSYKMRISSTSHSQGPKAGSRSSTLNAGSRSSTLNAGSRSSTPNAGSRSSTPTADYYILLKHVFVVGIGDDITLLVNRLTDPEDDFKVLGVVGPVGAGKTTLASRIYHHSKVQSYFSCTVFVSISRQCNRVDLLHYIYKKVMGLYKIPSTETDLVKELHDFMENYKHKPCLVVFDDIWEKEAWDEIGSLFPHTKSFKFILTTGKKEVPLYADKKCILHEPRVLTDDQMWELFSKFAVEGRDRIEDDVRFENLAKLMLKKCHGLPLAVVTLGGILRARSHFYEWEQINIACTYNILKGEGGCTYGIVEERLELSYLDLSTHCKPLFLYLAIIPEDREFPFKELARMWIAEGFITDDQQMGCEIHEDIAMRLLGELAGCSLVQVRVGNARNEIQSVRVTGLVREFCIQKAIECKFLDNLTTKYPRERSARTSRRVSVCSRDYSFEENQYLKTMHYDSGSSSILPDGRIRKLSSIDHHFRLLKVLSISNIGNGRLPKNIGNLIHLTYLSIVNTMIWELPESVRNLCNLVFLVYDVRHREVVLPNGLVEKMENLQVLELPDRLKHGSIKCNSRLGLSSERHKKLHTFKCGHGKWMTEDLPTLEVPGMRNLCFHNIEEMEEMEAVHQCLGFFRATLHTLECSSDYGEELSFDVEKLREFHSLWSLTINGGLLVNERSLQFPPNLLSLTLIGSQIREGVDLTKVFEQLSKLKFLYLGDNAFLGTKLSFGGTVFPQLQELTIMELFNLQEWRLEERAMDCLKKIEIVWCYRLKRLPERIGSITTLKELKIEGMPTEFCKRLGYRSNADEESTSGDGIGEDAYIIQHIPSIIFKRVNQY